MTDDLSTIRGRIHRKSHDYFTFSFRRWSREKRSMFYGATDALADTTHATSSYEEAISKKSGTNLLVCYGFLQALYVQQDAVITLSCALDLSWNPNVDTRLKQIRDTRNRLAGHPALAGEHNKPRRLSAAIIEFDSVSKRGFRGHVYFEDGFETVEIDAPAFREDNERLLSIQMQKVEERMDEQERDFRQKEAMHLLSPRFDGPFSYLMQRLRCDLTDEGRVIQSRFHADELERSLTQFQQEIKTRGFGFEGIDHHMRLVLTGLRRLKELNNDDPTEEKQNEFDLIYDGVEKNVNLIVKYAAEIDRKLSSEIGNDSNG